VAQIKTYRCRFQPALRTASLRGRAARIPMTEYLVPVSWWSYDDDRLDARGPAVQTKAQVEVQAYNPEEARNLVLREFGDYGRVGTAAVREA
jgi:hypothetical protein